MAEFMAEGPAPSNSKPRSMPPKPQPSSGDGCGRRRRLAAQIVCPGGAEAARGRNHPGRAPISSARPLAVRHCRISGDYAFAKTALQQLSIRHLSPHSTADKASQTITLTAPPDLQERLRVTLPLEVRDGNHQYALCATKTALPSHRAGPPGQGRRGSWPRCITSGRSTRSWNGCRTACSPPLAATAPRSFSARNSPRRTGLHAHGPDTQPQGPAADDRVAGRCIQGGAWNLQPSPILSPAPTQGRFLGQTAIRASTRRACRPTCPARGRHAAAHGDLAGELFCRHDAAWRAPWPTWSACKAGRSSSSNCGWPNQQAERVQEDNAASSAPSISARCSTNTASGYKTP